MPQLNKEKLDQMVEAVMKAIDDDIALEQYALFTHLIKTALTPFCMEMTDEEILHKSQSYNTDKIETGAALQQGIMIGAKLIRDGKL